MKSKSSLIRTLENMLTSCLVCEKTIKPKAVKDYTGVALPVFRCKRCHADLNKIFDTTYGDYLKNFEGQM